MSSADIRWMIAGLFMAFLAFVVLADVIRRIQRARNHQPRRPSRQHGFRVEKPPHRATPERSWKTQGRH